MDLPSPVSVFPVETADDVLAYYQTDSVRVPFEVSASLADVQLTYLNIYPLIRYIELEKPNYREMFSILPQTARLTGLTSSAYTSDKDSSNLMENMVAFKHGTFEGNASISANSIVGDASNLVITANDSRLIFEGPTRLIPLNVSDVSASLQKFEIDVGTDFYANITASNASVVFGGNPAVVLVSNNGAIVKVEGGQIIAEAESMNLLVRQLGMEFQGSCTLNTFHALGDFQVPRRYDTKEFYGDNVFFKGKLSFGVDYSDVFTIVHDFVFSGSYTIDRPLEPYDDTQMFIVILPYVFVFGIVFLSIRLLYGPRRSIAIKIRH
jgi:hypothetical protein